MDIQSLIEPPYPQHDFSTALSPTQPLPPSEDGLIPCNFDKKPGSSEEAKRRKVNSDASRRFRERERLKKLLNEKEQNYFFAVRFPSQRYTRPCKSIADKGIVPAGVRCMLFSSLGDTLALARVLLRVAYAQPTFRKYKNERHCPVFLTPNVKRDFPIYDVIMFPLERLPYEIVENIIELSLFSEPLGSHSALHTFQSITKTTYRPLLNQNIIAVFKSQRMRRQIQAEWQLTPDFDHARFHPYTIDRSTGVDLPSWAISNCPECFEFLLHNEAVQGPMYSKTGECLLSIAAYQENKHLVERIVASMDLKHIFHPDSLLHAMLDVSIFEMSTYYAPSFWACWNRIQSSPNITLPHLGHLAIENICRFSDAKLAAELLDRGVDLGGSYPDHERPGWWGSLAQEDPTPLLDWFWAQGHRPQIRKYLEHAVGYASVSALRWVLQHTECFDDLRQATYIAVRRTDYTSVERLNLILQYFPHNQIADNVQDLVGELIQAVCETISVFRDFTKYPQPFSKQKVDSEIAARETCAILKLKALGDLGSGMSLGLIEWNGMARRAELYRLTEALENLDQEL